MTSDWVGLTVVPLAAQFVQLNVRLTDDDNLSIEHVAVYQVNRQSGNVHWAACNGGLAEIAGRVDSVGSVSGGYDDDKRDGQLNRIL